MKKIVLPTPPNPQGLNPVAFNRAVCEWMNITKQRIEGASQINDMPLDQAFALGSYTITTSIAGTSTGTQVTNFLLTFMDSMKRRGILKPV